MEQTAKGANVHDKFDLDAHVERFRNDPKFKTETLAEIQNILTSCEYSRFINNVYLLFNSKAANTQGRLAICQYSTASDLIDDFWRSLLGVDGIKKFCCKP